MNDPRKDDSSLRQTSIILDSFRHWLKRDLISRDASLEQQAKTLFESPFVVLSHGTEPDPILNYGNRIALELWETDLPTLHATPSRLTAEPVHRDERARLLERVARDGYIDDYSGIRVSATGRRFFIEQTIVWNLLDEAGRPAGQAATFSSWKHLEGESSSIRTIP